MSGIDSDILLGRRYRLTRRIASGGMGSVWEAEDGRLHRRVAVKILSEGLGSDERFLERFRREAQAAAGLSHPNITPVFDYGEDGHTAFIVMELIEGETLAGRLGREGPLPAEEAARIAAEVAEALQAAHDAGIIHRDVKPGNVMLTRTGEVRVMDFGIAAAAWATALTASGATVGTASYISPEQARGERVTPASDVYSLGVVLYESLAGRPPFVRETPVAVAAAHVNEAPPSLRSVAPDVPESLAAVCRAALEKEPAARPQAAGRLAALLRTALAGGGPGPSPAADGPRENDGEEPTEIIEPASTRVLPATPTPVLPATPARPGRRRWAVATLALLAVAAVAGIVGIARNGAGPSAPSTPGPSPSATRSAAPAEVTVPNVAGRSPGEAEGALRRIGLVPKLIVVPAVVDTVVYSVPKAGMQVDRGATVTLYAGSGERLTPQGPTRPPKLPHGTPPEHGHHGGGHGHGDHDG